jgi:hypothetical protein
MLLELYEKPSPENCDQYDRSGKGNSLPEFEPISQGVLKGKDGSEEGYGSCSDRPLLLLRKAKLFP